MGLSRFQFSRIRMSDKRGSELKGVGVRIKTTETAEPVMVASSSCVRMASKEGQVALQNRQSRQEPLLPLKLKPPSLTSWMTLKRFECKKTALKKTPFPIKNKCLKSRQNIFLSRVTKGTNSTGRPNRATIAEVWLIHAFFAQE